MIFLKFYSVFPQILAKPMTRTEQLFRCPAHVIRLAGTKTRCMSEFSYTASKNFKTLSQTHSNLFRKCALYAIASLWNQKAYLSKVAKNVIIASVVQLCCCVRVLFHSAQDRGVLPHPAVCRFFVSGAYRITVFYGKINTWRKKN